MACVFCPFRSGCNSFEPFFNILTSEEGKVYFKVCKLIPYTNLKLQVVDYSENLFSSRHMETNLGRKKNIKVSCIYKTKMHLNNTDI